MQGAFIRLISLQLDNLTGLTQSTGVDGSSHRRYFTLLALLLEAHPAAVARLPGPQVRPLHHYDYYGPRALTD